MTRDEFAEAYARRSGVTVGWLKEHGREPRPCSCDSRDCEGWQMAPIRAMQWAADHGVATPAELKLLEGGSEEGTPNE